MNSRLPIRRPIEERLGELCKLDFKISRGTVVNILREAGLPTGLQRGETTWTQFIKAHAKTLWAGDFIQ